MGRNKRAAAAFGPPGSAPPFRIRALPEPGSRPRDLTREAYKHDKTGRSSTEHHRKFKPKNLPKACGFEQFGWYPLELMESEAYGQLSPNARRLVDRIQVEHVRQGGVENGRLVVTHEPLRDYGLTVSTIRNAIDECVAFGLIRMKRGGRWAGSNRPNRYGLTWIG